MRLGSKIDLGALTFKPPRAGPTLWEIGVPDRSAAEFFIPNTSQKYVNDLYTSVDKLVSSYLNLLTFFFSYFYSTFRKWGYQIMHIYNFPSLNKILFEFGRMYQLFLNYFDKNMIFETCEDTS
jgi:hypothetical protein